MLEELFDDLSEGLHLVVRKMSRRPAELLGFLSGLVVVALVLFSSERSQKLLEFFRTPEGEKATIGLVLALVGLAASQLMLRYLRADHDPRERGLGYYELHEVLGRVRRLEHIAGAELTPETREALVAAIKTEAASQMGDEFDKRLRDRYAPAMEVLQRAQHVRSAADRMLQRLQTEIRALMRRGNLNLVLGTVMTAFAIAMLAYVAVASTVAIDDWRRYVPIQSLRLSVAAFIEIFAFFFLRLYRTSLAEIKYFQNEITNVEAKSLALEVAILSGDAKAANRVVDQLAQTERNFVLKKTETTVELEKARLDSEYVREVAATLRNALPSRKQKGA